MYTSQSTTYQLSDAAQQRAVARYGSSGSVQEWWIPKNGHSIFIEIIENHCLNLSTTGFSGLLREIPENTMALDAQQQVVAVRR